MTPDSTTSREFLSLRIAIVMAALVASVWGGLHSFHGDNANSRLATVYSLVHHQSWYLDEMGDDGALNPFESGTIDKVRVNDRLLSSKPPVLPLLMAGVYQVLHSLLGLSLEEPDDVEVIVAVFVVAFTCLPFVLSLWFMDRTLMILGVSGGHRAICLFTQAFCSGAWVYASTLNNHVPAMACLTAAAWGVVWARHDEERRGALPVFFTGLAGGMAIVTDMPSGAFVAALGLMLLPAMTWRRGAALAVGGIVPLLVHSACMLPLTGSVLPVQMYPDWYLHEASYWRNPLGMDALNNGVLSYLIHFTFGRHGWFLTFPVMAMGLIGLLAGSFKAGGPWKAGVWYMLGALGAILGYYALRTNNFGGEAFGTRWLIITVPAFILGLSMCLKRCSRAWQYGVVAVILAVSFASAYDGHRAPWSSDREWPTRILGNSFL